MKDALGHGSAAHNTGIRKAVGLKVEKHVAYGGRTAAGQRIVTTGNVWQKVVTGKRRAVAERIAQLQRIDNPNSLIRIR